MNYLTSNFLCTLLHKYLGMAYRDLRNQTKIDMNIHVWFGFGSRKKYILGTFRPAGLVSSLVSTRVPIGYLKYFMYISISG